MKDSINTSSYALTIYMFILCLLTIFTVSSTFAGQYYKWTDEKGVVHITDQPNGNTKILKQASQNVEQPQYQREPLMNSGFTREDAIPFGVPALTSDGMELTVLSVDEDAWSKIYEGKDENSIFTVPRSQNKRMVMIRIRVKNVRSPKEPISWRAIDHMVLIGSYNKAWECTSNSESWCGVLPNHFPNAELYKGGEQEGNICFHIPIGENNLLLRYDGWSNNRSRYTYFVAEQ